MKQKNPTSDILVSPRGARRLLAAGVESVAAGGLEARADIDDVDRARMQAGLEQALVQMEDEEGRGGVLFSADHAPTSLLQTFLAEEAAKQMPELIERGKLVPDAAGGFEAKFDDRDFGGWVGSFFTWWRRIVDKHPFIGPPAAPDRRIPNGARIAVLGDWGSGRYGAPVSSATIQTQVPRYDMLLHLGDVYYSGTEKEIQERFLDLWPEVPGALSRALNSNHEMYAGGHGLFRKTLPAFGQAASCFAVENDRFLLVGLDTGYKEHELAHDQVPWLDRLIRGAEAKGQKVVLFSHHQPFSMFEHKGAKLAEALRPILESKRVLAWYWGHEHRCALYDKHPGWGMFGRLIGHGGYPYFRQEVLDRPLVKTNADGSAWRRLTQAGTPDAILLDGTNPYVPGEEHRYGPQGHLTLELGEGTIREIVHAPDGTVLYEGEIG